MASFLVVVIAVKVVVIVVVSSSRNSSSRSYTGRPMEQATNAEVTQNKLRRTFYFKLKEFTAFPFKLSSHAAPVKVVLIFFSLLEFVLGGGIVGVQN